MPVDSLVPADESERQIVEAALAAEGRLEVVVPLTTTPEDLYNQTAAICKAISRMEAGITKLQPIMGRALLLIKNNPEVYRAAGCRTFDDFIRARVVEEWGVSRTTAYNSIRTVTIHPNLEIERFQRIGSSKFFILNKVADHTSTGTYNRLLQAAENMNLRDFREYVEQNGQISPGETIPAVIVIHATQEIKQQWDNMVQNLRVQRVCDSQNPAVILQHMMEESLGSWLAEAEDQ